MTDRWNPKRVTVPTEKPTRIFMGGASPDLPQYKVTRYRCPVHGVWLAAGEWAEPERQCMSVVENPRPGITVGFCCAPSERLPPDPVQAPAVEPRGKTWGIRVRGDVSKRAPQVYRCPVHGEFTVEVPLDAVPDEAWCRKVIDSEIIETAEGAVVSRGHMCGMASPWSGSPCGIGHAAGEVMS